MDRRRNGETNFFVAPPKELEGLLRQRGLAYADVPKKDGTRRSIGFRKELSRGELAPWQKAWHLLGLSNELHGLSTPKE
jgi:hypothetical protein